MWKKSIYCRAFSAAILILECQSSELPIPVSTRHNQYYNNVKGVLFLHNSCVSGVSWQGILNIRNYYLCTFVSYLKETYINILVNNLVSKILIMTLISEWLKSATSFSLPGLDLVPGQSFWNLWWTNWNQNKCLSWSLGFSLPLSFHKCSTPKCLHLPPIQYSLDTGNVNKRLHTKLL